MIVVEKIGIPANRDGINRVANNNDAEHSNSIDKIKIVRLNYKWFYFRKKITLILTELSQESLSFYQLLLVVLQDNMVTIITLQ